MGKKTLFLKRNKAEAFFFYTRTEAVGGGIGGLLDQFNGRSQSNGGGGFMDIVKSLAGGAQEQQQRNGGSLLDLIKGFAR